LPTSSESDVLIRADNISKRYQLSAGQDSLKDVLGTWGNRLLRREDAKNIHNHIWALKDVSFEVRKEEALGVIGPNGAGKTTILKLLSKITGPTTGSININGRLSSLIELGAGFHPDLTGRENVFLNGVILGLTRREIAKKFDQIVEFAGIGPFIDMQVKRYSSGMYARLGFSVAAHVRPDILLVDEVLAVGDASFQQKCYDFIHSFVKSGNTTVFVSHNLFVVEQLCSRVLWLDKGQIIMSGAPSKVLTAYLDSVDRSRLQASTTTQSEHSKLRILDVSFAGSNGNQKDTFQTGENLTVEVKYHAETTLESPHFCLALADSQGGTPLILASMLVDGNAPAFIEGEGVIRCQFETVPLLPRTYHVWGEVWASDRAQMLLTWQRFGTFRVADNSEQVEQYGGGSVRHRRADAPIQVNYEWRY